MSGLNKFFVGGMLILAVFVFAGCNSDIFDGCLFNSICSGCGAKCIKSGFHAGDCEYNHSPDCPYYVSNEPSPDPTATSPEEETEDTTVTDTSSGDYSTARALTQSIVSRSERCGRLTVPDRSPSIRIKRYDLFGAIEFESSLGSGTISNTSAHREYMILTQNSAGQVGDSAASHGYKDSRWNKYWGAGTKNFCVILTRDNRGSIEEWSETIRVN